jgi:tetratricopeptide (TPR) repeat protein
MTEENLSERLNLYEAMYERNPRDGLISVGKTYLYILAGRPQDALKSALEASLSVSSKSLRVQLAIALGYYLRNKPGEALIESRYALNIDPAGPLCYLVHAGILLDLKRTDEARLAFLKCLSLASDNTFLTDLRLRNRRAVCAAQLENPLLAAYSNLKLRAPDMAETDVQHLIEQNPGDPVLKALCASLQRRSGRIREALALLEGGLAGYEVFPERLYLLWKTYDDQLGNHEKGETFVRRLLEVDPLNDRATGLGYSHLDEETLRHINFIKSLEDLPNSIFARILPIRDLEALITTAGEDTAGITDTVSTEEQRKARTFVLPYNAREPQDGAGGIADDTVAPAAGQMPVPPPSMEHMANLLEQAERIARDLRITPAPVPLLHVQEDVPQTASQSDAADSLEPDVDTLLQTEEPVASQDTDATSGTEPPPTAAAQEPAGGDTAAPVSEHAEVSMRDANRLLSESRFEEALQAFLELSRRR